MTYYLAPSLARLRAQLNELWPKRDKTSDGWIGDPSHQARKSDHNPDYSAGGVVRAIDIDEDGIDDAAVILAVIYDPRVSYVIYEGRIWGGSFWRPYTGTNKHEAHIHVSLKHTKDAEAGHDWNLGALTTVSTPATITPLEDILATLDQEDIDRIAKAVWSYDQQGTTKQAWHFQKNLATVVWGYKGKGQKHDNHWHLLNLGTTLLNTLIPNRAGKKYRWLSYIVNDNHNAWGNSRLLEELAKRNGVDVAQIEAALSGVLQAEMPELLAEHAVDVEVTVNPKQEAKA